MGDANESQPSLELMENELRVAPAGLSSPPAWLVESFDRPRAFWLALTRAHDLRHPVPGKSSPFKEYDLYYDTVVRHLGQQAPAFCYHDAELRQRQVAYQELGELVERRAAAWLEQGVAAEQVLCIVRPMGLELVVSVLAALKLGLTVSLLPPHGTRFLDTRLQTLDPAHIDTDPAYVPLFPLFRERVLSRATTERLPATHAKRSYAYPSGSVCALLFDPAREESHIPRPLTSDAAYLCALRDGLLALGLRRGEGVAAPGFHLLETQPSLLLACLLAGGSYLHLEPGEIEKDPTLLAARPMRAVGIVARVRDILLARGGAAGERWSSWFRNPAGSQQVGVWFRFVEELGLKHCEAANLKWDAALGGCSLFSVRRKGTVHLEVMPSAGVPWQLFNPAVPELGPVAGHGALALVLPGGDPEAPSLTGNIIAGGGAGAGAGQGSTWSFAGTLAGTHQGRRYPEPEVLDLLRDLPGGVDCCVCREPLLGGDPEAAVALLVFTAGSQVSDESELLAEIIRRITAEMGPEFVPDRIRFFPLKPRRDEEGEVDQLWCRDQYLSGALFRKSRDDLYRTLSQLRSHVTTKKT